MDTNSSKSSSQVVVLGGGYAGVLAALRLAARAPRNTRVVLVNAREHFVERIRLHQLAAGQSLKQTPIARLLRDKVSLVVAQAEAIDTTNRRLHLRTPHGSEQLAWDQLLVATGSVHAPDRVPGKGASVHSVATAELAHKLALSLDQIASPRVLVCGGGLTAIELATELAESRRAQQVTMITAGPIAPSISEQGRTYVRQRLSQLGVSVIEHAAITAVEEHTVHAADGRTFDGDAVVWCGGFAPTSLARDSALRVNAIGQMELDSTLQAHGTEGVWGAGDAATVQFHQGQLRMGCATAMPMAAHAADNIAATLHGRMIVPYGFHYFMQCTSLGRRAGIVQFVDRTDAPTGRVLTGALAARLKETVCRFAYQSMNVERWWGGTYLWPGRRSRNTTVELSAIRTAH